MTWRLRLVGTPAAWRSGETLALPFERRWQLVALLALRRDWVRRSEVAALLWPELPRALASTNLRKALFRLRDVPWLDALEADGDLLRLGIATDVDDFARQGPTGPPADALTAHRGPLLEGFDDDANEPWSEWLRTQRDRWQGAWRAAALQRLAEPTAPDEGLALAAAMLQADPLDEAALQAQLGFLARTGQTARAREAYRAFAQRLQQDLGVEPGSALRAAHDGLQSPPRAPAAPAPADDGYVGRTYEQRRIVELMGRPECRLLTVVGPGGIGKTRLVRRVLGEVAPLFAEGARFIALEDVDTAAGFVARLARSLEVAHQPARDEFESVAANLSSRHVLLALDNFEPIAATATPLLEQLLERAPRLKLLVTTRERLAIGQQWALPLDGLPCPEPEDMDRLADFDASRLFMAAAQRTDPTIDLDGERAAIVDICRQVDGLPLALELAAAWTRVMRCTEIARELHQGAELLRAMNPAFPPRQASLEAVFEQTWRLLGPHERRALAGLSVFRSGFTVEAARAVAMAQAPVLGALADRSLLRKEGRRLALHPLVQQFAALKLGDGVVRTAAHAAHARYFRNLLTELQTKLRGSDVASLRLVDDEFENCLQAFDWLATHGPASALPPVASALADHSRHRGRPKRCLATLQGALEAPLAAGDPAVKARLLALLANQYFRLDQFGDAEAASREALALARELTGEPDDVARETCRVALYTLGSVALERGRFEAAREHYSAMLAILGDTPSTRDRAIGVENLALIERRLGRIDEALHLAHESLLLRRRSGEPHGLALSLNNLASLHIQRGEFDAAGPVLEESRALCERGGFSTTLAVVMVNLADLALEQGDLDAAVRHGESAVALGEANGQRMVLGRARADLGIAALRRGDLPAAHEAIAAVCRIALELEAPALKTVAAVAVARLLHHGGHVEAARRVAALAAAGPSLSAADRAQIDRMRTEWGAHSQDPDPALTLDTLLHGAAFTAAGGHAALVSRLGG